VISETHTVGTALSPRSDLPRSGEDRQIWVIACVLLVTLRMSVGWHLLYEGWWKLATQSTAQPWSAEGYLKNALGPMRSTFREMTGDPNDLHWLDAAKMTSRWDDWQQRFLAHYPGVDQPAVRGNGSTADQLQRMLNGPESFAVPLDALPEGVKLDDSRIKKGAIRFDAASRRLIVDGKLHLLPDERDRLLEMLPASEETTSAQSELAAVNDVYKQQSKLSYKERLAALLNGDPERVGVVYKDKDGSVLPSPPGDFARYVQLIERYEANLAKAKTSFQFDHLDRQWREVQELRRRLVGPVMALESDLKKDAEQLLHPHQLAAGPVPEPWTQVRQINFRTMWTLIIVGALLIVGLFTRPAALAGAGLLTLFYLAAPPWPGIPEIPGPEHNYIVNKVYLEALTLLCLAALPTGRWFGLDGLIVSLWCGPCCLTGRSSKSSSATTPSGSEPAAKA
jgi:uncharacterized membrane protein YphA (DoxX/SURF4 family)